MKSNLSETITERYLFVWQDIDLSFFICPSIFHSSGHYLPIHLLSHQRKPTTSKKQKQKQQEEEEEEEDEEEDYTGVPMLSFALVQQPLEKFSMPLALPSAPSCQVRESIISSINQCNVIQSSVLMISIVCPYINVTSRPFTNCSNPFHHPRKATISTITTITATTTTIIILQTTTIQTITRISS